MIRRRQVNLLVCLIIVAFLYVSQNAIRDVSEFRSSGSIQTIYRSTGNDGMRQFVYNYVVHVTELVSEEYLKRLQETINLNDFPSKLLSVQLGMEESYPCLIPKEIRIKYPVTKYVNGTNFTMPFIFTNPAGRLGNQMGEYATQFALSQLYGISTALTPQMKKGLITIFPHLSMEQMPVDMDTGSLNCTPIPSEGRYNYNFAPSEVAAAGLFGLDCFEIKGYPFDIRIFNGVRDKILKEFTFSHKIQQEVRKFFSLIQGRVSEMKNFETSTPTYIGVHSRRKDYMKHMTHFGSRITEDTYFIRAIQYYRNKFTMPIFIATSDDMSYIQKVLQNEKGVFYSNGGTPETDLALLASCNHTIFSLGSFGFWAAYIAGGDAVYADVSTETPYTFTKHYYDEAGLSNFIPIRG